MTTLHPRLIVADPNAAIAFYEAALGANLIEHFVDKEGRVVHAALSLGDGHFSLAQSVPEWGMFDPQQRSGTSSLIHVEVENPDAAAAAFVRYGGMIVVAIADRPWGKREGRVADPSGHWWVLSTRIEDVSAEEIAERLLA
jgi:PhnB protein